MANYIAVVHKEDKSDFGVSFPDFPGCVTAGRDIDEAKDMAHDALALHIQGLLEDGEGLPAPSRLEEIMADPDYADATFNLARLLHRHGKLLDAAVYWRRYLALDQTSKWAAHARRALKFCEIKIAHS